MSHDVQSLAGFYRAPMGLSARRAIMTRLLSLWPHARGLSLLGYGFALPYLRFFGAERMIAACPAAMGAMPWPRDASSVTLCDDDALPFMDAVFDRILVIHALERSESLRPLLRQLWRVLAPEGRVLIVAPNRASLWAQVDVSPFAEGRPFSKSELDRILRDALFTPERWDKALYAPPLALMRGRAWDRAGSRLFPAMGGVHVVEAAKSLYAPVKPAPLQSATARAQPALTSDF